MAGAFYRDQLRSRRDHLQRAFELFCGAEGIAGAVDEQCWCAQVGQVLRALLLRVARRMERIGEQQESAYQSRLFRTQHAGLASAVGMAPQDDSGFCGRVRIPASGNIGRKRGTERGLYCGNCVLQSCPVPGGVAGTGRAERSRLPIRQIAAEHGDSGGGESIGQGPQ